VHIANQLQQVHGTTCRQPAAVNGECAAHKAPAGVCTTERISDVVAYMNYLTV